MIKKNYRFLLPKYTFLIFFSSVKKHGHALTNSAYPFIHNCKSLVKKVIEWI